MQDHHWESCGSVVSPDDLCRSLIYLHRLSGSSVFSSGREDLRCRRLMLVSCHLCDVITWWEQKLSALKIVVLSNLFENIGDFGPVTVTGQRYEYLLCNHVITDLQQRSCVDGFIFMQDDAHPHIANPIEAAAKGSFWKF
ncbi:uncharacterized protein TNCV_3817421 [Trichonephila clavipes]|nr:uncharacterized protein TNCV_3817421 [Trichonephila clavipes]